MIVLLVPFLRFIRALQALQIVRVAGLALWLDPLSRSPRLTLGRKLLTSRIGWFTAVTAVVILASSQLLYATGEHVSYAEALFQSAMAAVTGNGITGTSTFPASSRSFWPSIPWPCSRPWQERSAPTSSEKKSEP